MVDSRAALRQRCEPYGSSAQAVTAKPDDNWWSFDRMVLVGVSPGFGSARTGLQLTGAATVVRVAAQPDRMCLGLTAMFSCLWSAAEPPLEKPEQWNGAKPRHANREQALLVGPRWDRDNYGDTAFLRLVGGVRHLSGHSVDGTDFTTNTPALGLGAGGGIGPVMFDLNLLLPPWEKRSVVRFGIAMGYNWSTPLGR